MERMLREGEAPHGGLALLIGFGAGLAYAAQVVQPALARRHHRNPAPGGSRSGRARHQPPEECHAWPTASRRSSRVSPRS
nr:hypothetical protein [Angustibacter aerolatus]